MSWFRIDTPRTVDLSLILRGLFASSVVFWHVTGWRLDDAVWRGVNLPGRASVWLFFGLSGYVIAYGFFSGRYAFDMQGITAFYRKRASRILPLFWLTSVIALVATLWVPIDFSISPYSLFSSLLMLQWSHMTYPVGVFWTLGIEMQFYLVAPILCWAVIKAGRFWVPGGFGLMLVLLWHFGDQPDLRTLIGTIMFFLAGVLMARWNQQQPTGQRSATSLKFALILGFGVVALMVASDSYPDRFWNHVGPFFVILALILLLRAHDILERMAVPAGPVTRGLMTIGALAYGIYAWHGLLLVLSPIFQNSLLLTYLGSFLLAWASFTLVERPTIKALGAKRTLAPSTL